MIWIAPTEKDHDSEALEKRLWAAADQLRANSGLTSQQYSQPVLGLNNTSIRKLTDSAGDTWISLFSIPRDVSFSDGRLKMIWVRTP
jgi:hypothetical protein